MIVWLEMPQALAPEQAGGKAAGLGRLMQADLPVPPGFVVTAAAYRQAVATPAFQAETRRLLAALDPGDHLAVQAAATRLREQVRQLPLPPELAAQVTAAYGHLCPGREPVAVRSSATTEDGAEASFAGQQDTYLGVEGPAQVLRRVRDCWASGFTERAVAYRQRQGHDHATLAMAVVVQRLVNAEKAGVMFTVHPVSRDPGRLVVEACWGLGEALVSGAVSPDHYVVDKASGTVRERFVLPKREMVVRQNGRMETHSVPVPPERMYAPVLSDNELARLTHLARQVEAYFGQPQDVEWAMAGGQIYLLQSRPITAL